MKPVYRTEIVIDSLATGVAAREHRKSKSLSLREASEKMGISSMFLCDLEHGKRNWTLELVQKFNNATK